MDLFRGGSFNITILTYPICIFSAKGSPIDKVVREIFSDKQIHTHTSYNIYNRMVSKSKNPRMNLHIYLKIHCLFSINSL